MPTSLRDEIKQTRPFRSLEQEALLSVERTAAVLLHRLGDTFKPHDITPAQYNVLRILRGAGSEGLSRTDIRDRLVAQVPDVTRLLDRLEQAGYVARERTHIDRRIVTTRITPTGRDLLTRLDEPVAGAHRAQLGHMTRPQLKSLIELLAIARSAP
ncbi:MAG: MarR family transcriptional regulator [bacterium]